MRIAGLVQNLVRFQRSLTLGRARTTGEDWKHILQRPAKRPVELGHLNDQYAEILSGLSRGEAVVLYASDSVTDGARLTAR